MDKVLVVLVFLLWAPTAWASEPALRVTLSVGEDGLSPHPKDHPLLLMVTLSAQGAANARVQDRQTQRMRRAYEATEEFERLSEAGRAAFYAQYPLIGERGLSIEGGPEGVASKVVIEAQGEDGPPAILEAEVLAASEGLSSAVLSADAPLVLYLRVGADKLRAFPSGTYVLRARVTGSSAVSRPATLRISGIDTFSEVGATGDERPVYRAGIACMLDGDWDEAARYGGLLRSADPYSVHGLMLQGDGAMGRGEKEHAIGKYVAAIRYARALIARQGGMEEPRALQRRERTLKEAPSA